MCHTRQKGEKKSKMARLKRLLFISAILLLCVGCDRITKVAAGNYLVPWRPVSCLGDLFRLQYAENTGAFLGLGSSLSEGLRISIFSVLTGAVLAGMLAFVLVRDRLRITIAAGFSLIIGGGTGNLIDRLLHDGTVTDFLNVGLGSLRTGIFNLADVAIMAGLGLLICFGFYHKGSLDMPSK
jgi:signal peptidase II